MIPVALNAIVAMARNRVIGKDNKIPWYLPEDFKWFKSQTQGHVIVMGRKTFDSLPKALPNRENIVLSRRSTSLPGATVIGDISKLQPFLDQGKQVWVIGGSEIYKLMLPYCSDVYLTLVKQSPEGDTFFPDFEKEFYSPELLRDEVDFSILHYQRNMNNR